MLLSLSPVLQSFWIAFGVSAILAWPALLLLRKIRSESTISPYAPESHMLKQGTPNMGGIFVLVAIAIALAFAHSDVNLLPLLTIMVGFGLIGFVDDFVMPRYTGKRGLGWIPKLSLQVVTVAGYSAWFGFSMSSLWAAFFILFFVNAVNFADGLDALASSLVILALIPFVVAATLTQQLSSAIIGVIIIGALLPFLVLNSPPAKMFMGDVGALAIGGLYGHLFAASPWETSLFPWIVSVVLILELVMVPMQIVAVKTIERRIFPATPIHHGFEKSGWPESKVLWTFIVAQCVLASAALTEILR